MKAERRTKGNHYVREGLSALLAFFLTLFLSAFLLAAGVLLGLLNQNVLQGQIQKSDYFPKKYEEFLGTVNERIEAYRLPAGIVEEQIPLQKFYVRGNKNLNGGSGQDELSEIRNELEYAWQRQILNEEGLITEQEKEYTRNCAREITAWYENETSFPFFRSVGEKRAEFLEGLVLLIPCLVLCGFLACVLILRYRYRHKGLRYVVSALLGAVGNVFLIGTWVFFHRDTWVPEGTGVYYQILSGYFKESVKAVYMAGLLGAAAAALLILLVRYKRKRLIESRS